MHHTPELSISILFLNKATPSRSDETVPKAWVEVSNQPASSRRRNPVHNPMRPLCWWMRNVWVIYLESTETTAHKSLEH